VDSRQRSVRATREFLAKRPTRTLFPQASQCCLWIFLWKTPGPNCDQSFLLHRPWILFRQFTASAASGYGELSTG
jgi:hypothetical protein